MKNCPKKFHTFNGGFTCNGKTYKEFDNLTHCEYQDICHEAYENYKTETEPFDDGMVLKSIKHPFSWKWWFKSLNNFFRRPKFSKEALEPAEKIKVCLCPMHSAFKPPVEAHNASCEWGCSAPDRHLYKPIPFEANDMMEEKVKIKTGMGYKIKVVPSPRIDYCGACKKEHGFDCPLDEVKNEI